MFHTREYKNRRSLLKRQLKSGIALFLGNSDSPMNYSSNTYPFRQDSDFLYFFGWDAPNLAGLMDIDEGRDYLFGTDASLEDIIWMGTQPTIAEMGQKVAVEGTGTWLQLEENLRLARENGRIIHFLPSYRGTNSLKLKKLLDIKNSDLNGDASEDLILSVIHLRSKKSKDEIDEMERALEVTHEAYEMVIRSAKPGIWEYEIAGKIRGIAASHGREMAYPIILSVRGEILHNHHHFNQLQKNQLLIVDAGAESPLHYASDITRTYPVGGKFNSAQRDIYELVLKVQTEAIASIRPGKSNREIHLEAATTIASGLKDLGLMKGEVRDAVEAGAHALFFPHGLGHMIGLDVHDMEGLGEDYVGYDKSVQRSDQFGLAYLRLAKQLQAQYVLTVEPGIYFIPALIEQWKSENKNADFIEFSKLGAYMEFGGIRIEDDVLVTDTGSRVLGKSIPKEVDEIEDRMNT